MGPSAAPIVPIAVALGLGIAAAWVVLRAGRRGAALVAAVVTAHALAEEGAMLRAVDRGRPPRRARVPPPRRTARADRARGARRRRRGRRSERPTLAAARSARARDRRGWHRAGGAVAEPVEPARAPPRRRARRRADLPVAGRRARRGAPHRSTRDRSALARHRRVSFQPCAKPKAIANPIGTSATACWAAGSTSYDRDVREHALARARARLRSPIAWLPDRVFPVSRDCDRAARALGVP